jgi:excisionase family DNA binding protein
MKTKRATFPRETEDEHLTTEEVAELCHTSPGTVHYWRSMGKGPKAYKVGRRLIFRRSEVQAWINAHASDPAARHT